MNEVENNILASKLRKLGWPPATCASMRVKKHRSVNDPIIHQGDLINFSNCYIFLSRDDLFANYNVSIVYDAVTSLGGVVCLCPYVCVVCVSV